MNKKIKLSKEKKTKLKKPTIILKKCYKENCIEAGIDEVGRGCLSGPVVAAAVVLPKKWPDDKYLQIKDSKKLSAKKRKELYDYIIQNALGFGIGFIKAEIIDDINILQASFKAMHKAIDDINLPIDHLLVDGHLFKPYLTKNADDFIPHTCIIEGDNKYLSIAAASILAKESRDQYMINLCNKNEYFKKYGWEKNKGYATKQHREAIMNNGLTKYHRRSFGICKRVLQMYKTNLELEEKINQTKNYSDTSDEDDNNLIC